MLLVASEHLDGHTGYTGAKQERRPRCLQITQIRLL